VADKWIDLGVVGVDSGMLMVGDPCYLGEWKEEPYQDIRLYRDKKTEEVFRFLKDFNKYDEIIEPYGECPNTLLKNGTWSEIEVKIDGFSYNGVAHTGNEIHKQINYEAGHPGRAVAFRTGYGDGCYPVSGKLDEDGRIVQIVIDME